MESKLNFAISIFDTTVVLVVQIRNAENAVTSKLAVSVTKKFVSSALIPTGASSTFAGGLATRYIANNVMQDSMFTVRDALNALWKPSF